VRFAWTAPTLAPGQVFDVRVCPGANCLPVLGKTHTTALDWVWCPDGGAGRYRWQVAVVTEPDSLVVGPVSPIAELDWPGGECAEPPSTPAPPPEPTSSDPPLEP
jgi:hypothetical protein